MFTIQQVDSQGNNKQYLLRANGANYYIGELIYLIIQQLTERKSRKEIVENLNNWARGHYQFTEEVVGHIIQDKITPLNIFDEAGNPVKAKPVEEKRTSTALGGFSARWDFVQYEQIKWLLNILKFFFYPIPFFTLLAAGAALNYYYIHQFSQYTAALTASDAIMESGQRCLRSLSYVLLYYPAAVLILFIHELGHAASAHLFKAPPKSIGFGFYFIFPVLYTDVTDTWKLNRWKRTIVNLGGIFFQVLINLALIYWIKHAHNIETIKVLRSLMIINTVTIFINFNPFFKFDGYWIYSDLFKIPNLRQQSNAYWVLFLKRMFPKAPFGVSKNILQLFNPRNPLLILYTVCNYAFWVYVMYWVIKFIGQAVNAWGQVFASVAQQDFSICAIEHFLQTALITSIFGFIFTKRTRSTSAMIRARIQAIKNHRHGKS
ncbi:MAG: hypothetical protein KDD12_06645 [Lewinella sp.]|nr:hypothetical protein [Lewinella sp.]